MRVCCLFSGMMSLTRQRLRVGLFGLLFLLLMSAAGRGDSVVVFNEIMYHAAGDDSSLEYVELRNLLSVDVDMSKWKLRGGVDFDFPVGTIIPAKGYLVVAASPSELQLLTGCTNAVGPFEGRLANDGETLRLYNNSGRILNEMAYGDGGDWPVAPDGSGVSLAKMGVDRASEDPETWHYSSTTNGTPGEANDVDSVPPATLVINEVSSSTGATFQVELRNVGAAPYAVNGVVVSVAGDPGREFTITNTPLVAGNYLLLTEAELGFRALTGEALFLYAPGKSSVLDARHVKSRLRGLTSGRRAEWLWPSQETPGSANIFELHDEIVINEIMYHQRPSSYEPYLESDEQWIELYNRSAQPVDLAGWELDEAVRYTFPSGVVIGAGEFVVVAGDVGWMATNYPALTNIVYGPFSGRLSHYSEDIVLRDPTGTPADFVRYYDGGRWPQVADGYGSSLELRDPDADNSCAEAWAASDEFSKSPWRTYTNQGVAASSQVGQDALWKEFVMGLNDAGEVLIDDISVVENPSGTPIQFLQNGSFDSDSVGAIPYKWRIIGNHRHSEVIVDPDNPANKVLRLVGTGPTENLHNHAETTFANSESAINGIEYKVTFKARWVKGSSHLNTRLYLNRLAKSFRLETPTLTGSPGATNSCGVANIGPTCESMIHSPAVPTAGQTVTVTAHLSDPDNVQQATCAYSVNESGWGFLPMAHQGEGVYSVAIPAQAASSVVQFLIMAEDGLGTTSYYPAAGPDSRALYKVDDGAAAVDGRHNFRIVMLPSEAAWMRVNINVMSNDRLGCTVIDEENDIYYGCGVRHKGSEHHRFPENEVGFNVRFPSDQRFRGVHKTVAIDRTQGVVFGQREMLINFVMNRAGGSVSRYSDFIKVLAPRAANTSSAELQMARYGSVFLDEQFENGSEGTAYEYELIYNQQTTDTGTPEGNKLAVADGASGIALRSIGADKDLYRWVHLIENNRVRDDYARYIDFLSVMSLGNPYFNQQVGDFIDVDEWLRSLAINVAEGCGDSFAQGASHNAQFYVRPSDQRVLFLPHDMDAFHQYNRPMFSNAYLNKLVADTANLRNYLGHMYDVLTTSYNGTYIQRWTDQLSALSPEQNFEQFRTFIIQRNSYLMGQILQRVAAQYPFSVTTPDSTVASTVAVVEGAGWIDVREIYLEGLPDPMNITWTSTGSGSSMTYSWSATVPLDPGANDLVFTAYDYQGELLGSDTVTITSTVLERPLSDSLRLTELMYDPLGGSSYEFVELCNTGSTTLDLTGVAFSDGIDFTFETGMLTDLPPGGYVVLASDLSAFTSRYDAAGMRLFGPYLGQFSNGGEGVRLQGPNGEVLFEFEYSDGRGWPLAADGSGHSLVPVGHGVTEQPQEALYYGGNWRASRRIHGSPGAQDPSPGTSLRISEFEAHTDLSDPAFPEYDSNDWIELLNAGESPVALTNWYLSDDAGDLLKWALPSTSLPAGARIVFDEISGFHQPITTGFGLNKAGEQVVLSYMPGTSEDGIVDAVRFRGQENGISLGRRTDTNTWWQALTPTRGGGSQTPVVGVVLDAVVFDPPPTSGATGENTRDEFVRIVNTSEQPIELWNEAGCWRVGGDVSFTFPSNTVLGAGEALSLVSFDPEDAATLGVFVVIYGGSTGAVVGPYVGTLPNRVGRVVLERPQAGDFPGEPVSWVLVDEAIYFRRGPWPTGSEGFGRGVVRTNSFGSGNNPANWALFVNTVMPLGLYWNLDEGAGVIAADSAPRGLDGTLLDTDPGNGDGSRLPAWTNGISSNALYFDGVDDLVRVEAPVVAGYPFTMSAWVRPQLGGGQGVAVQLLENGLPPEMFFSIGVKSGRAELMIFAVDYGQLFSVSGTTVIDDGQWHHVAGVFESATAKHLYVDGQLQRTMTTTLAFTRTIGRCSAGMLEWLPPLLKWKGEIDEVRIYPIGLTGEQVMAVADAGNPMVDRDGDGMPDGWERLYFAETNAVGGEAVDDWDGDRSSNLDEYTAGTNPTNDNSVFELRIGATALQTVVSWPGIAAEAPYHSGLQRLYSLSNRTNLLSGSWTPISGHTNLVGSGAEITYTNGPGASVNHFKGGVRLE